MKRRYFILVISLLILNTLLFLVVRNNLKTGQKEAAVKTKPQGAHFLLDMEEGADLNASSIISTKAFSGSHVSLTDKENPYSAGFRKTSKEIHLSGAFPVQYSAMVFSENTEQDAVLVFEVKRLSDDETILWTGIDINSDNYTAGEWVRIEGSASLEITEECNLSCYVWNKGDHWLYIDDIELIFGNPPDNDDANIRQEVLFLDMESEEMRDKSNLKEGFAHSGNFSALMEGKDSYSAGLEVSIADFPASQFESIGIEAWVASETEEPEASMVITINDMVSGENVVWTEFNIAKKSTQTNEWYFVTGHVKVPADKIPAEGILKVYAWNKKEGNLYIDDIRLVLGGRPGIRGTEVLTDLRNGNFTQSIGKQPYSFTNIFLQKHISWKKDQEIKSAFTFSVNEKPGVLISAGKKLLFVAQGDTSLREIIGKSEKQICLGTIGPEFNEKILVVLNTKSRKIEFLQSSTDWKLKQIGKSSDWKGHPEQTRALRLSQSSNTELLVYGQAGNWIYVSGLHDLKIHKGIQPEWKEEQLLSFPLGMPIVYLKTSDKLKAWSLNPSKQTFNQVSKKNRSALLHADTISTADRFLGIKTSESGLNIIRLHKSPYRFEIKILKAHHDKFSIDSYLDFRSSAKGYFPGIFPNAHFLNTDKSSIAIVGSRGKNNFLSIYSYTK